MTKSAFNKEKITEEFEKVSDEVKDTAEDIETRRTKSSDEEKITMFLGVIFLIRALYELRGIVWGIIILVIGILFVTGFFDSALKSLISYTKKQYKACKKSAAKKESKKAKETKDEETEENE